MNFIPSIILAFLAILIIFASVCFVLLRRKLKGDFVEMVVDRVSSLINSKIALATDLQKAGPWYLVVYTQDSNYPIWVSNNNIRSVHPDPEICRITVKQFNGEDMMIENVISYELCSANDMCEYEM